MVTMYTSISNHTEKTNQLIQRLQFTHIKHKNNTNITQLLGRYVFMTYLREIVNQKVNILMKRKLDINLDRKSG